MIIVKSVIYIYFTNIFDLLNKLEVGNFFSTAGRIVLKNCNLENIKISTE